MNGEGDNVRRGGGYLRRPLLEVSPADREAMLNQLYAHLAEGA